ncbi:MAG: amidinotransferase [Flavobacteriales bacterium]|nr:amidinotransferase [Flavobacteriales bacterium]|tara:strand:+ start:774 stop:1709 length:936 start_codon:yes stop_codon:yes gene_type:complete
MKQITDTILMMEPVAFRYNEQTSVNNYYQQVLDGLSPDQTQKKALSEFNTFVDVLREKGINVIVVKDTLNPDTPDSIFPNNWVSFHESGNIALYPMYADNRRDERREDILDVLVDDYNFKINYIKDFTEFEDHDKFLEGTGSMVLDRENRICYAAISVRTDEQAVLQWCDVFDYTPVCFTATQDVDGERMEIYHTNVMICVADKYAVVCLDTVDDKEERKWLRSSLEVTRKEVIEISEEQKHRFAGNMLQLMGDEKYLVMSTSAYNSLTEDQITKIEKYNPIISSSLDTIEACGGGSARCMMAEVFLPKEI